MLVGYHENRKTCGEGDGLSSYKKSCDIFTIKYWGSWNGNINPEPSFQKKLENSSTECKFSTQIIIRNQMEKKHLMLFHGLFPEIFDRYMVFIDGFFPWFFPLMVQISPAGLRCPWPSCPPAGACA